MTITSKTLALVGILWITLIFGRLGDGLGTFFIAEVEYWPTCPSCSTERIRVINPVGVDHAGYFIPASFNQKVFLYPSSLLWFCIEKGGPHEKSYFDLRKKRYGQ